MHKENKNKKKNQIKAENKNEQRWQASKQHTNWNEIADDEWMNGKKDEN